MVSASILVLPSQVFADENDKLEFFEKQIRPLLVDKCYACHSGTKASGGLTLDSAQSWQKGGDSGPALVAGKPQESLLIDAVRYKSIEMPPADKGGQLSPKQIALLEKWIEMGAPAPRTETQKTGGMSNEQSRTWWAYQPLPEFEHALSPEKIDSLLEIQMAKHGLTPEPIADRRTLVRRISFGLTGLPPSSDEVKSIVHDKSANAIKRFIDQKLASEQYGIHWGRRWLDIVRYADTAGENTDRPLPHAWRYRNWVMKAFNDDLPYDKFVQQQIAGDLLATKNFDSTEIVAAGYLAIARRFGHDIDKDIHLMYEDVIDNLGKSFLGLSLGCARCHDHKYDPFTMEDYYAIYGVFDSTLFSFPGCEPRGKPDQLFPLLAPKEVAQLNTAFAKKLKDYENQNQPKKISAEIKRLAGLSFEVLSESNVAEGKSEEFEQHAKTQLNSLELRKGELLQLTVLPNGNHGADTTKIEWRIENLDTKETWNVQDLITRFVDSGPAITDKNATWCLLDVTDGPFFMTEKRLQVAGNPDLKGWASGDTPSSIVNQSKSPVKVFTTLPPESFFVHPGVNRNVAVAWICPSGGRYRIRGTVTDAHPAGLDGVSFRLEHFRDPQLGEKLLQLYEQSMIPKPMPPTIPVAYSVNEKVNDIHDSPVQQRGDPEKPGDVVRRRWIQRFGGKALGNSQQSGRLELANEVTRNPLFARVMVNRIWQWHFGRGLVASPNDFGSRGIAPSHPELLERLAVYFRDNGYRIKTVHRLIMATRAYQRRSSKATEQDPSNEWLSRFSRRRLTAEEIRDSLMLASGNLDLSFGKAHPFPPSEKWTYTQHDPFTANYPSNLRSAFLMVQRQRRHPFLALFDGADPNSSTPVRDTTTVPSQALFFLNDPIFHEQVNELTNQIGKVEGFGRKLELLYDRSYQRGPAPEDIHLARDFLDSYPGSDEEKWSALGRVILSSNEFLYVD